MVEGRFGRGLEIFLEGGARLLQRFNGFDVLLVQISILLSVRWRMLAVIPCGQPSSLPAASLSLSFCSFPNEQDKICHSICTQCPLHLILEFHQAAAVLALWKYQDSCAEPRSCNSSNRPSEWPPPNLQLPFISLFFWCLALAICVFWKDIDLQLSVACVYEWTFAFETGMFEDSTAILMPESKWYRLAWLWSIPEDKNDE